MSSATDIQREIEDSRKERTRFIEMVRAEEQFANRDPKGYKRKVFGLVALAYAYIFGVLLFAILLVGLLIFLMIEAGSGNVALFKLVVFVGIFVLAVLRSLWVKISPPDGVVLKRSDAPVLYKEVDEIADRLQAPRPQDIRIDYRLNAAASQTPRLGMFGWYRNTLLLGLPLLLSLSHDEARAVIAHEFGHFSGSHGKFGAWAYRVGQTWRQMGQQFSSGHVHGAWLFAWFVNWFQPKFAATTFALRRANEYEADRAAAEVAGAENIANGLMRMTYLDPHLDETFWEDVQERAKDTPTPPPHLFAALPQAARSDPEPEMMRKHLANALADTTDYDDTHPSLSDRLAALGRTPTSPEAAMAELAKPIATTAAEAFFGAGLNQVVQQTEAVFADAVRKQWAQEHQKHRESSEALRQLREKAQGQPLGEDEQVNLAYLVYTVEGRDVAEPIFRNLHELFPTNALAMFWLGHILASREDPAAEALLQEARERNPRLAENAIRALAGLYHATGQREKLAALREEATDTFQTRHLIDALARTLQLSDVLEPNGLGAEEIATLGGRLGTIPELQVAYLVRKVLPNGERRFTLVAFHRKKTLEKQNEAQLLVRALLQVGGFPERTVIFSPKERKEWIKRLDQIPGAKIVDKGK